MPGGMAVVDSGRMLLLVALGRCRGAMEVSVGPTASEILGTRRTTIGKSEKINMLKNRVQVEAIIIFYIIFLIIIILHRIESVCALLFSFGEKRLVMRYTF